MGASSQLMNPLAHRRFGVADPPIVAYVEREAMDPETGEPGILRQEWRVRDVEDFAPEDLINAFGSDWRRYKPFASHVLEHRYIRRGTIEPWTPFQTANSWDQAIEYVDDYATPIAPALVRLHAARAAGRAEAYRKEEEERERRAEAAERSYHRDRSEAAFTKLASGKDKAWADRWNDWVAAHQSEAAKERAQGDPEFMDRYRAVMTAETVPAKRRAIKDFLTYVEGRSEFGRFRGLDGLDLEDTMRGKVCVRTPGGKVACGVEVRGAKGEFGAHGGFIPITAGDRKVLYDWHAGQWSAAYSVASRGGGEPVKLYEAALEMSREARATPNQKHEAQLRSTARSLMVLSVNAGYEGGD